MQAWLLVKVERTMHNSLPHMKPVIAYGKDVLIKPASAQEASMEDEVTHPLKDHNIV